jgi:glycogen operon protein
MFTMGDEVRRTQHGNNNAYVQDNALNWLDWSLPGKHADMFRFVKLITARRSLRDTDPERKRMSLTELISQAIIKWHGVKPNQPDWTEHSHSIALSVYVKKESILAYFIFNAYWRPLEFELPTMAMNRKYSWKRWIDTFLDPPEDIVPWQESPFFTENTYRAGPRSVVVLWTSLDIEQQNALALNVAT